MPLTTRIRPARASHRTLDRIVTLPGLIVIADGAGGIAHADTAVEHIVASVPQLAASAILETNGLAAARWIRRAPIGWQLRPSHIDFISISPKRVLDAS